MPARRRPRRARANSGFTVIEILVVMALVAVAMIAFSSASTSVAQQRARNRENLIAADAASSMLETRRGERFADVFARYNGDEADDPDGPGTAPGNRFAVQGLERPDAPNGLAGEIQFPSLDVANPGDPPDLELREDLVDARFGMPRDLSGDSIIDGADHSGDYFVLPVEVRIAWSGKGGEREFRIFATLCEFNWE